MRAPPTGRARRVGRGGRRASSHRLSLSPLAATGSPRGTPIERCSRPPSLLLNPEACPLRQTDRHIKPVSFGTSIPPKHCSIILSSLPLLMRARALATVREWKKRAGAAKLIKQPCHRGGSGLLITTARVSWTDTRRPCAIHSFFPTYKEAGVPCAVGLRVGTAEQAARPN